MYDAEDIFQGDTLLFTGSVAKMLCNQKYLLPKRLNYFTIAVERNLESYGNEDERWQKKVTRCSHMPFALAFFGISLS